MGEDTSELAPGKPQGLAKKQSPQEAEDARRDEYYKAAREAAGFDPTTGEYIGDSLWSKVTGETQAKFKKLGVGVVVGEEGNLEVPATLEARANIHKALPKVEKGIGEAKSTIPKETTPLEEYLDKLLVEQKIASLPDFIRFVYSSQKDLIENFKRFMLNYPSLTKGGVDSVLEDNVRSYQQLDLYLRALQAFVERQNARGFLEKPSVDFSNNYLQTSSWLQHFFAEVATELFLRQPAKQDSPSY
jgi:hypothetical protein